MTHTTSIRLQDKTLEAVDKIASALNRSRAFVLKEAVEQYVQREQALIADIEEGLKAVKEGRTISHSAVVERMRAKGFNV